MAAKKHKKFRQKIAVDEERNHRRQAPVPSAIHPNTTRWIFGVFLIVLGLIFFLGLWGKAGVVGAYLRAFLAWGFGVVRFLIPPFLCLIGLQLLRNSARRAILRNLFGGVFLIACLAGFFEILGGEGISWGGNFGVWVANPLTNLFGGVAAGLILSAAGLISVLILLNFPGERGTTLFPKRDQKAGSIFSSPGLQGKPETGEVSVAQEPADSGFLRKSIFARETQGGIATDASRGNASAPTLDIPAVSERMRERFSYAVPPFDLLDNEEGRPTSGDIKANANIIKRTLSNFGIEVEMGEVRVGPTVTQFTLKPAEGVKLSRITALNNDLSLSLAAHPIRIEAPIPGRSLVGIEIPNKGVKIVRVKPLLQNEHFQAAPSPLTFVLGRDVAGEPAYAALDRMPHLLIAGATGTGKTICLNALITALLFRNSPDVLRFIFIDPKRVEFPVYNGIPHLLTPVIVDTQKTVNALRWTVMEMDRRFDVLSEARARDIVSYNRERKRGTDPMPYLVVIIDELADLMAGRGREIEATIVRLAQMARAVGIHLVVATQRPSVEVITGLIKANITSRIAFQVASQIDSRTILDAAGAEKLLGRGDMLFLSAETSKPRRLQGAFIAEKEVKRITDFLRESRTAEYEEGVLESRHATEGASWGNDSFGDSDPLYEEAKKLVIQAGKASASYLQRRLRVGYARAARLIDLLEENGVVGPGEGAKPREILMDGDTQVSREYVDKEEE